MLDGSSFQVLVDSPCPDVKKENAFEDTMFLIDLLRQTKEKENKQKKVSISISLYFRFHIVEYLKEDMIRNMALEQKRKMQKN